MGKKNHVFFCLKAFLLIAFKSFLLKLCQRLHCAPRSRHFHVHACNLTSFAQVLAAQHILLPSSKAKASHFVSVYWFLSNDQHSLTLIKMCSSAPLCLRSLPHPENTHLFRRSCCCPLRRVVWDWTLSAQTGWCSLTLVSVPSNALFYTECYLHVCYCGWILCLLLWVNMHHVCFCEWISCLFLWVNTMFVTASEQAPCLYYEWISCLLLWVNIVFVTMSEYRVCYYEWLSCLLLWVNIMFVSVSEQAPCLLLWVIIMFVAVSEHAPCLLLWVNIMFVSVSEHAPCLYYEWISCLLLWVNIMFVSVSEQAPCLVLWVNRHHRPKQAGAA